MKMPTEVLNWGAPLALVSAAAGAALYYGASVPHSQLLGPSLVRGPLGQKRVALTFDDGPTPPYTDRTLDVLLQLGVTATFFVNGNHVDRFPDRLLRMRDEGHTIGNHTYSHPFLYLKTPRRIAQEIDDTQAAIERAAGIQPRIFRPPYGGRWFGLWSVLKARGMTNVQWSDTGYDWIRQNTSADIARKSLDKLQDGSVILLHDGAGRHEPGQVDRSRTVEALPAIVDGAQQRGLRFVSVLDFLN